MIHRTFRVSLLLFTALLLSGHVGNPSVVFQGSAGPYPVRVVVRPPEVVPGQAEVSVRVAGEGIRRVAVQPVFWRYGTAGAPPPDEAAPVQGVPGLYAAPLWLMTAGSYSVRVEVAGTAGAGSVMVPVGSVATRVLAMNPALGWVLAGLGLFLFVGAVSIVGAAVREGVLAPGQRPDAGRRRRARWASAGSGAFLILFLTGGKAWWDAEDAAYRRNVDRPVELTSRVVPDAGGGRALTLEITDSAWRASPPTPIVPDHGKLMHLFLVAEGGGAFAHLHPAPLDSLSFRTALPSLPAGRYRVYGDVVHESGFARTLVDTVALPGPTPADRPSDPDDSWHVGAPDADAPRVRAQDGSTISWERPAPLRAREPLSLDFSVRAPDGSPAILEPYMGMTGHAVVARDDGAVFVHLHPQGTLSMASQALFEQRERGDTLRGPDGRLLPAAAPGHGAHAPHAGSVSFPFEFPRPGRYHVWVQVKREGRVLTGAFEAPVQE